MDMTASGMKIDFIQGEYAWEPFGNPPHFENWSVGAVSQGELLRPEKTSGWGVILTPQPEILPLELLGAVN